jgi:rhamnosyl/mannosyltransferase
MDGCPNSPRPGQRRGQRIAGGVISGLQREGKNDHSKTKHYCYEHGREVLHFFKTYLPDTFGGIEHVIFEIAEGVTRRGVATDVLTLSRHPRPAPIAVGHHTVHQARLDIDIASTGLSLAAFGAFARLAAQADVLHYHFPYPFADLVHLTSRVKKPVVTYHSDIVRQKLLLEAYRPLMHAFMRQADRIVATSPNYLASSEVLQRYAAKTSVIPIALAGAAAKPGAALLDTWRTRLGPRFFLFVGALRYYKGLSFLLDAAERTGLPVVIAGSGEDEARLRLDASRRGISNVTFLGHVSEADKAALLALCHAFVFPSHLRSEAFGVALLEAATAGKAMISCEIGTSTRYVNVAGKTGLVVPPADGAALADAMRTLWNDEAMAKNMGDAASARAARVFAADVMADAYVALYRELAPGAL